MPRYRIPNTNASRLAFMEQAIVAETAARADGTTSRLSESLFAELAVHFSTYTAAHEAMDAALNARKGEVVEGAAAMSLLQLYIGHMLTAVSNRAHRENLNVQVLGYYGLTNDGSRPTPSGRREWVQLGESLVAGDAEAVANGYAPVSNPSALELQAVLGSAKAEMADLPTADARYNEAQTAVNALLPRADELIKEVRDEIIFSTRKMDNSRQRRVLRNFGSRYDYLPGEVVDDGEETAVGGEGAINL